MCQSIWNIFLFLIGLQLCIISYVYAELTPPYFNLATGRKIYATATCGVGVDEPELYCKLVGANTENDNSFFSVIQGQVCDTCDPSHPDKHHPPEYAIDGTEAWWQSPPLSRGMKYNEVNLTIDFGQEFHVAYIFIRMANSPRPGLWTLEKSTDNGKTWTPWQHFSDTPADCEIYFGKNSLKPITKDDDVICTTEYSKIVPLENGEIPVMLLNNRPSANNYFNSTVLQEWTRATNVRIRLLRTKNLLGHLMSVARQDPTVTRRYFYSIKDISIGGRCMCNGHADTCDVLDPTNPVRILACRCQHRTCGIQCNECCSGFVQKKWRQNTNARPFQCEPCNCFGHSNRCKYVEEIDDKGLSLDIHGNYEGGGVCQDCQHNTDGINCNKCKPKYYRPYGKYWNETDVCWPCDCEKFYSTGNCEEETGRCECRPEFKKPDCQSCAYGYFGFPNCRECDCNLNGTDGYHCEAVYGICPCKQNFAGPYCKQCADTYFNYPTCEPCNCDILGSDTYSCEAVTGQCICRSNFGGIHCEMCKDGYYNHPNCTYCDCNVQGTLPGICDKNSGQCLCREGYLGPRCDRCIPGYYNFPDCIPCNCSSLGSISTSCSENDGKCNCLENFAGRQCTQCSAGYYGYPECLSCNCNTYGSEGVSCNSEGQCSCLSNFDGKLCEVCKEGFYNYPTCEECNCDPAGVIQKFAGCGSVPAGELCQCKERVTGRICDQCRPLYWNLSISNPDGCELCDCYLDGTISSLETCDIKSGQCTCKPSVQGRQCKECKDGTYELDGGSLFGCKDCDCDIGGSRHSLCDKLTGQCVCHQRITGRTCSRPLTTHYFPTLYQFQFEYEDGYTPSGAHVRYQWDESNFPGFSRKGYAVFSNIQNEVINEVNIFKSSVYRMVIRYHNPTGHNVTAGILITSDNPLELDQKAKVLFKPTHQPQFVTVSGVKGDKPSPIVLDPGRYTFGIKTDENILLDYFALLPAAYYEASILTKKIESPCQLDDLDLCRNYRYPSVEIYKPVFEPLSIIGSKIDNDLIEHYNDEDHMKIISHHGRIPILSPDIKSLKYPVIVPRTGRYVIVVDYVSHREHANIYYVNVRIANSPTQEDSDYGAVLLYPCLYSMVCRQPVIDDASREKLFFIDEMNQFPIEIYDNDNDAHKIPIVSITAIPVEKWSVDFIKPSPVCVMQDSQCVPSTFRIAPSSKKIEIEIGHEARISHIRPPYAREDETLKTIYLSDRDPTLEIQSKASEPGRYVIIVQYYQSDNPKFQIPFRLTTEKQIYDGKFDVNHCPSSSGCRGLIRPESGNLWFDIDDEFNITFTNNRVQGLWLDYILLVPVEQYHDDLLDEETFDQTKEFIQQCGQDHFHIQLNASDFCRNAVFSLTADYNNGALQCNCDYEGSHSFECDPFGGQCQCKPNVIGRRCEACRTGYWGFPDCKHCDCPALCEKDTGRCICPLNVMGEKCDQCEPYTYGFHQLIGCEECNCNRLGVEGGNLQCDLNNGTCSCRPNIEGRACDQCSNGFYNFPLCDRCRCDLAGTTNEICDKADGNCFCKKNVVGVNCDRCIDGTYNLQKSNPDGCTQCFCFGKTTRCENAFMRVFNVSLINNVSINSVNISQDFISFEQWPQTRDKILINETTLQVHFLVEQYNGGLVYFGVLDHFASQNNHLTAYGGYLVYTLYYTSTSFGKPLYAPDIILHGKDIVLIHESYEQPSSSHNFKKSLKMVESNFLKIDKKPVSRAEFMMALRDLQMVYIRANYEEQTVLSQLSDVYLTLGAEDDENYREYKELPVERCHCPPGYTGLSCENCATGYYRIPDGLYGGYCVPCQCHGHTDTCDCNTGKCLNCMHYTTGDHCEKCIEGYHGNATYGTPYDCMICACPLPYDSNNFAVGCEISETGDEIHCECKPGYTGATCESCAAGFYGQPKVVGDYCKPCECSGNIDPNHPNSCDTITGDCLLCLNNTYGKACNLCAPGYYGDAVKLKDCKACDCDNLGLQYCDQSTGICNCLPNVIGERCDRCKPDYYGHVSGLGCKLCGCGLASNSTQCDDATGQCLCKPGVSGRQCDRCANDYWNYTEDGCIPCSCNKGFSRGFGCNTLTGQCECLPNVIGEKCDACPHRWVLEKDRGCFECDACHHALLNVTDDLHDILNPFFEEFKHVARAHFTRLKLENYKSTARKLYPKIEALHRNQIDLSPQSFDVMQLEDDVKNLTKIISYGQQTAEDNSAKVNELLKGAIDVLNLTYSVSENARNTIKEVKNLAHSFDTSVTTKTENAKTEADTILSVISSEVIDVTPIEKQLQYSQMLTGEVENFVSPAKQQSVKLESLMKNISLFEDKLNDLKNWSTLSLESSSTVNMLNRKNKEAFDAAKFDTVQNQTVEINRHNEETNKLVINGNITCDAINKNLEELKQVYDELKLINDHADKLLPEEDIKNQYLKDRIDNEAYPHSSNLTKLVDDLISDYLYIKQDSELAIKAVNAYSDIYNAVNQSRILTDEAKKAVSNATISADGLRTKVDNSVLNARDLLGRAKEAVNKVEDKLQQDLDNSVKAVEKITDLNNKTNDNLSNINTVLEQFSNIPEQSNLWNHAYEVATDALADAKKSSNLLTPIVKQINMDVEKSQNISKSVDNTDKDISQIRNHIERVIEVTPTLENLTKNLQNKQKIISSNGSLIGDQIEEIKRQIERARAIANSINFGVSFNETTTLELKTPETVPLLGTESKISLFFNTTNPNGFLMYLGNDKNKTNKYLKNNTDFVAIEIENGYPVLTIDLGNGPEKIINTKYVADGHWYHAIVDRTGNNVKFIIREQIGEGKDTRTKEYMQEKVLPGQFTVFNVDKNSRLFIGGYSAEFIPPNDVTKSSFQGEIEGLKIGDEEVGLWNFVDAYNNKQGAKRRNTFLIEDTQHTGYRFNGNGFVSINANSYNINKRCSIHFKFKASKEAPDGLMFYAGKYDHFIALEMNNGGIKFQYQMGQHLVTMKTELNRAFNDDEWHTVEAERDGRKGKLRVDQNLIYQEEAPLGAEEELRISEYIYFGGVPGKTNHSQIIDRNFDGCIKDVRISATNVDLSAHVKAYGIRPGCPNKFSTVISYPPNQYGYLKKANINANNNFQIHLKFKTRQSDGIIFYAANHDQTSSIGLTIHDGILVLTSARAELTSGSRTFNDGEEHIVTATHNDHFLRLTVDDSMNYTYPSVPPPLYISPGDIFFAGLPNDFSPPKGALSTLAYFSGCISAVTLNGQIVNFANTTDRKAGHLDSCSPDIFDYDISSVPIYYPGKEIDVHIIPEESYKPSGGGRVPEHTTVPWIPREEITVTDAPPTIVARKTTTTIAPHHTRPQMQRPATKFPKQSKKTDGECALPINPEYDYEFSSGIRFGIRPQSRIEATISTKIHKKYDIVLEMKTDRSNGLLFYASDAQFVDFFALYIQNGQLYHVISCSSDKARLESSTVYDDNQWHKIHFSRNSTIARLYIDDNEEILGEPRCSKPMNIQTPLYFGSVSSASQSRNITQEVIHNLNLTDVVDYFGCIRNIQINGKQITSFSPHNVISCSEHVENGVFFGMDNKEDSYVKLLPTYFVGTQLTITFEMRPRVENGLIMSVAGNKYNYMILQLYNGSLYFNVMTSGQELEVKFSLTDNESFCDGQWRKVQAIKTLYVLTLAVNDISAAPAVGNSTKISTNTHRPLFLGGHQYLRKENRVPGIKVRKPYYGCIRNIKIGDVSQVVTPQMAHGDVWTGVCPLF